MRMGFAVAVVDTSAGQEAARQVYGEEFRYGISIIAIFHDPTTLAIIVVAGQSVAEPIWSLLMAATRTTGVIDGDDGSPSN